MANAWMSEHIPPAPKGGGRSVQFSMANAKVHTYDAHADSHGSRAKSSGSQTTSAVAGSSASDAAGAEEGPAAAAAHDGGDGGAEEEEEDER